MTRKEILKHLKEWERLQKALDAQLDLLYDLTGTQPESPLLNAIYGVAEGHTKAVAQIVGDGSDWLDWWKWECEYGARVMQAANLDQKLRKIDTLSKLAGLIAG